MKRYGMLLKIEALLFVRDFYGFFFTFIFPVLMLIIFGSIYGNEPSAYFGGKGAMDMSVPAYCAMIVAVTGLMAFPLTLAECKDKKIYKRFDATPAGKGRVMVAQMTVNFVMTVLGFGILVGAGLIIYDIRIDGSALAIAGAFLLSIGAVFSMGFFFTAIARDAKISNLLCYVSYFIMIFLSGATMPMEMFPQGLRTFARFLPLTYVVELFQGTFQNAAFGQYGDAVVVLSVLMVVCTLAGGLLYRRKSWA